MPQSTPLDTYRHNRKLGYSPQASAISTIQEWADTTTVARDRTNRVRKVCPPTRRNFDIRGYRNG